MIKVKRLSARAINKLSDGFHSDGGNLFLRVRGRSRSWIFRYKKHGKQISIGLGATHARSLQEARKLAERMRNVVLDGKNPKNILREECQQGMTFKEFSLLLFMATNLIDINSTDSNL